MVAVKWLHFTPCPPSPARSVVDPKSEEWILTWLSDLSVIYPDLLDDLPGYAKALCKLGYKTLASLAYLWLSCTPSFRATQLRRSRLRSRSTSCWQKPSSLKQSPFTRPILADPAHPRSRSRSQSPPQRRRSRSPPPQERRWQAYGDKL